MKYRLEEFNVIDDASLQGLAQAGIHNTDALLGRAGFPQQRAALVQELGLPEDRTLQWAGLADLVRVKGVGIKLAQLLIHGSVRSVQDLAGSDPRALRETLKAANTQYQVLKQPPSEPQLAECIEEAQELRTRLVVDVYVPPDFQAETEERDQEEARVLKRFGPFWLLFFVLLIGLALAFVILLERARITDWSVSDASLAALMREAEKIWFLFRVSPMFSAVVFVSLMVFLGNQMWRWAKKVMLHLRARLFNRPVYQNCYLYMRQSVPITAHVSAGALAILALIALMLVAFLLTLMQVNMVTAILVLFIPIASIVLYPDVAGVWRARQKEVAFGSAALQRYLGYRLIYVLVMLLWVFGILQVLLPGVFLGHRLVFEKAVIPIVSNHLDEITTEVASLSPRTADDLYAQSDFLYEFDPAVIAPEFQWALLVEDDGDSFLDTLLPQINRAIIWLIILVIVAFFVLPFILLGKLKYALLFLGIVIVSETVEQVLTKYAPGFFFLPKGSLLALVLSAALLLSNTILFDWFYQERTEEYKLCVACGHEVDAEARYCPQCGNPQPATSPADAGGA
jgi:hypothetical protein